MDERIRMAVIVVTCFGVLTACSEAPEEPEAVTLDAGYAVYTAGPADRDPEIDDLKKTAAAVSIVGPQYGLDFRSVFVTASLTGSQARSLDLPAAWHDGVTAGPGRELLVAVTGQGRPSGEIVRDKIAPKAVLRAGGADLAVRDLPAVTEPDGVLVASIPAGSDPELAVTKLGRTQTLDLRTGDRGGDSPEVYYPMRVGGALLVGPGIGLSEKFPPQTYNLALAIEAQLGAYSFQRGWAPPGRAWLMLTVLLEGRSNPVGPSGWRLELDLGRHLTVQGQGLPVHPIKNKIVVYAGSGQPGFNTAIAVAEPFKLTEITFTLTSSGALVTAFQKRPRTQNIIASSDTTLKLNGQQ